MKKQITKVLALVLAASMVTGCNINVSSPEKNADEPADVAKQYSVTEKTLPFYMGSIDDKVEKSVYFINDGNIPYVSIDFIPYFIEIVVEDDHQYEITTDDNIAVITRKGSQYTASFDYDEDTITFLDYDAFMKWENDPLISLAVMIGNTSKLFKQINPLTNDRYGKKICFDLKPYSIDLVRDENGYYIPLHTVSDLFCSFFNSYSLYNGKCVIITTGLNEDLADLYYSSAPERTKDFAEFDYHELCFALDHLYGLKEIHGIDSFDEYFFETGIKKRLMGTDQSVADAVLFELITCYFDDLHSSYKSISCGSDRESVSKQTKDLLGPWNTRFEGWIDEFDSQRRKAYPDGIPPYEEVGNTAYITFDHFTNPRDDIDYLSDPTEEDLGDTIRLMQYSYDQIIRKDSPVENVVLDLSSNVGGSINAACYVLGMFLGIGDINIKNTMTGATTTSQYYIDSNRDGKFDDKDTLADKGLNLYCLESPVSFSCGNLVPNEFKSDPHVTLLGKTSGGGSCSVMPMATAGGSIFNISGYRRMSMFKNGSFYDIDRGAEPDYYIDRISDFYDRQALTDLINGMHLD